jgi:hypothetical protein
MGSKLTAHRVFPALRPAGTALRVLQMCVRHNLRIRLRLWRLQRDLLEEFPLSSHNSVMVSPGIFEAMGQKVNGLCTFWSQNQKSSGSRAESANQPKNIFHRSVSSLLSFLLTGWMQQERTLFVYFVCLSC